MAPLMAGKPKPANKPMMEITTKSSTKVKEASFRFGKFLRRDRFMLMTTPFSPIFHQHKNHSSHVTLLSPQPHSKPKAISAFTLVELLGVITVIGVLAGLTLGAAGAVRRQGATSQAKGDIAALQAACERYYAENNTYPLDTSNSPSAAKTPTGSTPLFSALFGSDSYLGNQTNKRYFEPNSNMLNSTSSTTAYFVDPWGNAYGYNSDGTNAPLIWSTAGAKSGDTNKFKWITSWPQK